MGRLYWVAMLPVKAILYITVPDCRLPGRWRKLYPLTFIMSVAWIAAFSYIMVWMITIAGTLYSICDRDNGSWHGITPPPLSFLFTSAYVFAIIFLYYFISIFIYCVHVYISIQFYGNTSLHMPTL
jgi:hypothetical protein